MLEVITRIARDCGEMMLSAHSGTIESETKSGFRDLVTTFDKKIQDYAVKELSEAFPEAHFLCEEGDFANVGDDGLTFVIDPIDGTANFTHHYGHSCISIGCLRGAKPVAAVIYDPFLNDMFTAELGKGAQLNGEPIHVTDASLKESLVIFGTAPYNLGLMDQTLGRVRSIYGRCQDIRRTGSAALDLCYVAAGRVGLYFEMEVALWDYAAGALIVSEAGGRCCRIDGTELPYDGSIKPSIIAGSDRTIEESLQTQIENFVVTIG